MKKEDFSLDKFNGAKDALAGSAKSLTEGPFKYVLIVFLIIAAYFVTHAIWFDDTGRLKSADSGKIATNDIDMDAIIDSYKDEDSDIKGKTKYDLYKMGLNVEEGSDTDMDGLSDKDEIEKYGSDPTKYSTAGDLYSDQYKIEKGLDVKKKIDGGEDQGYPYNECSNITLYADEAIEFNANVRKLDSTHESNNITVYAEYLVSLYQGKMDLDVSGYLPSDVSTDDVNIYICEFGDSKLKKMKAKFSGNVVSFTTETESASYYVVVGSKKPLFSSISFNTFIDSDNTDSQKRTFLVCYRGFASFWCLPGGPHLTIYATDLATEEETEAANQALINQINYTKDITGWGSKSQDETLSDKWLPSVEIVSASELEINAKYNFRENLISGFRQDRSFWFKRLLYSYFLTDNVADIKLGDSYLINGITLSNNVYSEDNNTGSSTTETAPDGFTIGYDNFDFTNISSEDHEAGNCAGLTYLMAEIYNSKGAKAIAKGKDSSWDFTKYQETQKLLTRGINDFMAGTYVVENYGLKMTRKKAAKTAPADLTFYNAMTYYQQKYGCEGYDPVIQGGSYIDYTTIDTIKDLLNQGYVLELGLYTPGYLSHMVLIYGWYEANGVTKLMVYDCNFTDKKYYTSGSRYDFQISVNKIYVNGKEKFTFDYTPELTIKGEKNYNSNYRAFSASNSDSGYTFNAYISLGGQRNFVRSYSENTLWIDHEGKKPVTNPNQG